MATRDEILREAREQTQRLHALAEVIKGDKEHELNLRKAELGLIGRLFGSGHQAPFNIAGFAIILSFLFIALILFLAPQDPDIPRFELITFFGGVIALALGYVFGHKTGG